MMFTIQICFGYSLFIKKERKKKALSVNKQISLSLFPSSFFSLFFTLFCTITTICLGKNCTGS